MTANRWHKVSINTTEYQFAHGHKPRGRGMWVFDFDDRRNAFVYKGTYSDAMRQALFTAVHSGVNVIKVGA